VKTVYVQCENVKPCFSDGFTLTATHFVS